jgi:hypothetical protein
MLNISINLSLMQHLLKISNLFIWSKDKKCLTLKKLEEFMTAMMENWAQNVN